MENMQIRNLRFLKVTYTLVVFIIFFPANIDAAPLYGGFAFASGSAATEENAAMFREARFRVIVDASKYERVPYLFGGTCGDGFDCSGFVYRSFRDALEISVPRTAESLYSWAEKIDIEEALPADLVFFRTTSRGNISHVGIYLGGGYFIHSASHGPQTGVIHSNLNESYWSRTFAGIGRALPAANMEISR